MLSSDCSKARCQSRSVVARSLLVALLTGPIWLGCSGSSDGDNTSTGGGGAAVAGVGGSGATAANTTGGSGTAIPLTGGAPSMGGTQSSGGTSGNGAASSIGGAGGQGAVGAGGAATGGSGDGGSPGTGGTQGGGGPAAGGDSGAAAGGAGNDEGTPGCGSGDPLESGTFTIDVDGTSRKYVLDVPTDYDTNNKYPLFFVWHPLGGSADQVVRGGYDGLKSRANGTAIFVAPDGLDGGGGGGVSGQGWWNQGGGDMKFLSLMLDHFKQNLCIDQSRIFSSGFSFGGMMSYAVGFEYGDVFRALAPQSGNLVVVSHNETTTNPIAIMAFHGDADDFVDTSGGRDAFDAYRQRNHCGDQTQPVDPSPCIQYQDCDVPTIWCEFPGGHQPWSQAPQAIWDFFSQF